MCNSKLVKIGALAAAVTGVGAAAYGGLSAAGAAGGATAAGEGVGAGIAGTAGTGAAGASGAGGALTTEALATKAAANVGANIAASETAAQAATAAKIATAGKIATTAASVAPFLMKQDTPKIGQMPGGSVLDDYDAARKTARNRARAMGASGKASTLLTKGNGGTPSFGAKTLLGE